MQGEAALAQFHAALKLYAERPLLIVANLSADTSTLVPHWGRLTLPPELDLQNDTAIHYHLRDLFTGERYVRSGETLVQEGLVVGLSPGRLHVLQVEDVRVEDVVLERSLVAQDDLAPLLDTCSRRVGVVGDVHGEPEALREVLRALRFIDASGAWCARDGSLVLTGDIGHGPGLAETFDFLGALAAQAHARGGRVVWTLGNHDLFSDPDGGQGGGDSVGYRLWPQVREAALRPERTPGLLVCAVHCEHGKLFVHGGVLPHVVDLARAECGAGDAQTVADYINALFREALAERERLAAGAIDHPIFRVGTSHAAIPRMPGEAGYEPAGVFTPDLRELDHYRFHAGLLPQVVGHTASRRGRIRYAPGSWFSRDYIAVDVGRQHGRGNAGLLLTDFGWLAVTPGAAARLVEVSPLFARVVGEAVSDATSRPGRDVRISGMLGSYFRVDRHASPVHEALRADLTPAQLLTLEDFVGIVRAEARCLVVTDLTESLWAFLGAEHDEDSLDRLCRYLQSGGAIVFASDLGFEWFHMRLLRPLIEALGNDLALLPRVPLILSGGENIFVFRAGGYMLHSACADDAWMTRSHSSCACSRPGEWKVCPSCNTGTRSTLPIPHHPAPYTRDSRTGWARSSTSVTDCSTPKRPSPGCTDPICGSRTCWRRSPPRFPQRCIASPDVTRAPDPRRSGPSRRRSSPRASESAYRSVVAASSMPVSRTGPGPGSGATTSPCFAPKRAATKRCCPRRSTRSPSSGPSLLGATGSPATGSATAKDLASSAAMPRRWGKHQEACVDARCACSCRARSRSVHAWSRQLIVPWHPRGPPRYAACHAFSCPSPRRYRHHRPRDAASAARTRP
jgi:hypothetical protein